MKWRIQLTIQGLAWLACCGLTLGQERIHLGEHCVFDGSIIDEDVYGFDSDEEALNALRRVLRHTGLEPNFVIRAANVPNAVASIQGKKRYVLYNQKFMMSVRDATNTDWGLTSILAHEIGHHLQGHTLVSGGSRPESELQADKYSGFVLQRMGATLDQAQAAMQLTNEKGSETHPGRNARLAAIVNGWRQAKDMVDEDVSTTDPPSKIPEPQSQPSLPSLQSTQQPAIPPSSVSSQNVYVGARHVFDIED